MLLPFCYFLDIEKNGGVFSDVLLLVRITFHTGNLKIICLSSVALVKQCSVISRDNAGALA